MDIFRIVQEKYAASLLSSGRAARWNEEGQHVIYTSASRSLATLELLVHLGNLKTASQYKVLVISVNRKQGVVEKLNEKMLPRNWREIAAYPVLQQLGSSWYRNRRSLVLQVPSVIIPRESNYIINTKHTEFQSNIRLIKKEAYFWDERL